MPMPSASHQGLDAHALHLWTEIRKQTIARWISEGFDLLLDAGTVWDVPLHGLDPPDAWRRQSINYVMMMTMMMFSCRCTS